MEEEYIKNQERMKPQDDRNEEERSKVDDLRGSPMAVGSLEEIIDENHAIVSTSVGSEHYVSIFSFVDKVHPFSCRSVFTVGGDYKVQLVWLYKILNSKKNWFTL